MIPWLVQKKCTVLQFDSLYTQYTEKWNKHHLKMYLPLKVIDFFCCNVMFVRVCHPVSTMCFWMDFAQTSEVRMLDTQDWGQELVSDGWVFGGCQDDLDFLVGFWLEDLHILIRMVVENMGSWCYGILWEGGQLQGRNKAFLAASQTFVSFKNALLTPYFLGGSVRGGRFTSLWNPSSHFCRQGGDETDGGRRELGGKGERSYVSGSGSSEWILLYPWGPCMVWYVYLHLPFIQAKCRWIYQSHGSYG